MAGQVRIWHAQQLELDNPIYNIDEYLDIQGELDLHLFEAALRQTMREAESYQLRFSGDGELLRQHVAPRNDWPFHVVDLSHKADPRAAAERWMVNIHVLDTPRGHDGSTVDLVT